MLNLFFNNQLFLGLAQAAVTAVLVLVVIFLARQQRIHLESETMVALLRGIVQIVIVGSILGFLLSSPAWTSIIILIGMMVAAATIAARRAKGIPGAFWVSFWGIVFGAGLVIVSMTALGVIDTAINTMVPVGSMIIANAMNTNALALERFRSEMIGHRGEVEARLALGAAPSQAAEPYVQAAVQASLIPRIDTLRSLGIVWIPGLMAGMVLAGSDPIYAAIYQFATLAMIYAAAGLTSIASTLMIRSRAFSHADQFVLVTQSEAMAKA